MTNKKNEERNLQIKEVEKILANQMNVNQQMQLELQNIKSENVYFKDLIHIANQNYERLEMTHKDTVEKNLSLVKEKDLRE